MRGIIIYYSKTGNNERIANYLKEKLNFQIEKIIDKKKREGVIGFIISGFDALTKKLTQIEKLNNNLENFDHIIIGTPIWAGNITPAIRTFIMEYKDKIKSYSIFSVSGLGEKNSKVLKDLEELIGYRSKNFIFLKESELSKNLYEDKLKRFIEELEK
ncbi:MAG: flavodoxin domain-containing protein [Caldisericia bacterium]|nr:flavodoxin domain-containing protein [Caldisericia bacterium]